jgi:hypothetical protein
MTLPPGSWSSQRHWHSEEDEFVYVLEGEVTLIEDGGETVLHAGDCATFPKGTGNGHHLINKSSAMAVYLEVGSRNPHDLTTCSDIDMMSSNADGRFVHKDGTPYPIHSGALTDVSLRSPTYVKNSHAHHTWDSSSHQTAYFSAPEALPVWVRFPSPAPFSG